MSFNEINKRTEDALKDLNQKEILHQCKLLKERMAGLERALMDTYHDAFDDIDVCEEFTEYMSHFKKKSERIAAIGLLRIMQHMDPECSSVAEVMCGKTAIARTLTENGIATLLDLKNTTVSNILGIKGIGKTAMRLIFHAAAARFVIIPRGEYPEKDYDVLKLNAMMSSPFYKIMMGGAIDASLEGIISEEDDFDRIRERYKERARELEREKERERAWDRIR